MTIRRRFVITGKVQNVGYRVHCAREAKRLGVVGQVSNLPDGSVEVHAEGTVKAVEQLEAWCHQGSPFASVGSVTTDELDVQGDGHFRLIR